MTITAPMDIVPEAQGRRQATRGFLSRPLSTAAPFGRQHERDGQERIATPARKEPTHAVQGRMMSCGISGHEGLVVGNHEFFNLGLVAVLRGFFNAHFKPSGEIFVRQARKIFSHRGNSCFDNRNVGPSALAVKPLSAIILALLCLTVPAWGHEVVTLDGRPLGFEWPASCCGLRDCSFIPASTVKERPDGYHVTLKPGEHPMLKEQGYSAIIPYGRERVSPTGDYAICLSSEGLYRYCFFAGSRGF